MAAIEIFELSGLELSAVAPAKKPVVKKPLPVKAAPKAVAKVAAKPAPKATVKAPPPPAIKVPTAPKISTTPKTVIKAPLPTVTTTATKIPAPTAKSGIAPIKKAPVVSGGKTAIVSTTATQTPIISPVVSGGKTAYPKPTTPIISPIVSGGKTATAPFLPAPKPTAPIVNPLLVSGKGGITPSTVKQPIYNPLAPKGGTLPLPTGIAPAPVQMPLPGAKGVYPTVTPTTTSPLPISGKGAFVPVVLPGGATTPTPTTSPYSSGAQPYGPAPVPSTASNTSLNPFMNQGFTPYGGGNPYGMTAEQAAESMAESSQAAASGDALPTAGEGGGGGGGSSLPSEGEAAGEGGEKPKSKIVPVVAGVAAVGVLAWLIL